MADFINSIFGLYQLAQSSKGARAGLMAREGIGYGLYIFYRAGLVRDGGCGCSSGISTALGIQARQRRLANPLSPTL